MLTVTGNRIGGSFCGIQVSRDDGGRRIAGIADQCAPSRDPDGAGSAAN